MGRTMRVKPATISSTRGGTGVHAFYTPGMGSTNQACDRAGTRLETNQAGFCQKNLPLSELKRIAVINGVTGGVRGYATLLGL